MVGYEIDICNTADMLSMRPTHKLIPNGASTPIALCGSGKDAARIAEALQLMDGPDLRASKPTIYARAIPLPEAEIMQRAREAAIAERCSVGGDENTRKGKAEGAWQVQVAARALRDLAKPLSELVPAVDPDLAEARKLAAERASKPDQHDPLGHWCAHRVERINRGEADDSPIVADLLAAIRRGRELAAEIAAATIISPADSFETRVRGEIVDNIKAGRVPFGE